VATASRPPLYYRLLDLPPDVGTLERRLKVDIAANFHNDRLARAGVARSGVSKRCRLVERHPAESGAFWLSYDFTTNDGTGNLFQFPLGPIFAGNPYSKLAFEHAESEVMFNLPNGLQAYMLVDGKGQRIDAAPVEVVRDAQETSGSAAVVAGLSCMACHRQGVVPVKDTLRDGLAISGAARDKAELLYLASEAMDRLLALDESRFLKALGLATAAFLKLGDDQNKAISDFPEPVGAVARAYLKDLGVEEVAADLGVRDPNELTNLIKASARLHDLGLAPLLEHGTIKRIEWDSLEGRFLSRFQEAARELELGTPFRSF
jgi:serine/threonine-protein kinase